MANKKYYPAVFQTEDDGTFSVWLHDFCGVISQGDSLEQAIENIKGALGLYIEEATERKEDLPKRSDISDILVEKGQFVSLIEFDWIDYLKKHNNKAVKKTLTIPAWLNDLAEEQKINFSRVLQDALKAKLKVEM